MLCTSCRRQLSRGADYCGTCGTPLTFESTRFADETDVTICSLDDPEQVPPRDHTRAATKLSWVKLADGLPVYPEQRTKSVKRSP